MVLFLASCEKDEELEGLIPEPLPVTAPQVETDTSNEESSIESPEAESFELPSVMPEEPVTEIKEENISALSNDHHSTQEQIIENTPLSGISYSPIEYNFQQFIPQSENNTPAEDTYDRKDILAEDENLPKEESKLEHPEENPNVDEAPSLPHDSLVTIHLDVDYYSNPELYNFFYDDSLEHLKGDVLLLLSSSNDHSSQIHSSNVIFNHNSKDVFYFQIYEKQNSNLILSISKENRNAQSEWSKTGFSRIILEVDRTSSQIIKVLDIKHSANNNFIVNLNDSYYINGNSRFLRSGQGKVMISSSPIFNDQNSNKELQLSTPQYFDKEAVIDTSLMNKY